MLSESSNFISNLIYYVINLIYEITNSMEKKLGKWKKKKILYLMFRKADCGIQKFPFIDIYIVNNIINLDEEKKSENNFLKYVCSILLIVYFRMTIILYSFTKKKRTQFFSLCRQKPLF